MERIDGTLEYLFGLSVPGRGGDDMSDPVPVIAFPNDRRLGWNIEFDLGNAWYSSFLTAVGDPIKDAIAISN